jgi:predicted phosphodiesterase
LAGDDGAARRSRIGNRETYRLAFGGLAQDDHLLRSLKSIPVYCKWSKRPESGTIRNKRVSVWGLVSDVHGNLPALEEALGVLAAAGAARFAFLGDYLGRGDSDACVRLIRDVAAVAVVGNRDLDWQHRVSPITREWVLGLPRFACVDGVLMAHGDARLTRMVSTSQIARQFNEAWAEMERRQARVAAFGHSHYARVWHKASAAAPPELLAGSTVALLPEGRYFVNVGTTGLPFPGKGPPSVALLDLERCLVQQLTLNWKAAE